MNTPSHWFSDPTTLLEELRRGVGRSQVIPTIPGYDDLKELFRGGQGVVYAALQRSTRRRVAIKVLLDGAFASRSARRRFEREIDLVAGLQHPHIVRVYDSGVTSDDRLFLVMEFIDGQPLDEFLGLSRNGKSVPLATANLREKVALFADIADAVNFAHQRGVIHRDLKPGNIRIDPQGSPHVLDFGLAKTAEAGNRESLPASVTGQFVGSLPWASPEQADGKLDALDVRTDVYSLGVMLYQALTGRFPYTVTGAMRDVLDHILRDEPARPGTITSALDSDLDTIVLKCLAKDPARRYQSAGELARDLRRHLAGEPIEARRDSTWYVLRKTVKRHKTTAILAATLAIFALGFGVLMAYMYDTTRTARDAERAARLAAETSAAQSIQIGQFLQDMLASVDPATAMGRDVTVLREVLDNAARRIDTELPDQPNVSAALHHTIGVTYVSLALFQPAAQHLRTALETRRKRLGDIHPDTLASRNAWNSLLLDQSNVKDAALDVELSFSDCRKALGPRHPETLRAQLLWGRLLREQTRLADAEPVLHDNFGARKSVLGATHVETIQTMNELATLFKLQGKIPDAVQMLRDALALVENKAGADSHAAIAAAGNLALMLGKQDELTQAEEMTRATLDRARTILGERHMTTVALLNNLASIYHTSGRLAEAEPLYLEAWNLFRSMLGDRHDETLTAANNYARIVDDRGRPLEVEELMRNIIKIWGEEKGEDHPSTLIAVNNLANMLERTGRLPDAEPLYRKVLEVRRRTLGDDHPDTILSMNNLAMLLLTSKEYVEAESLARASAAASEKVHGADSIDYAIKLNNLSSLLVATQRADEALPLMEKSLDILIRKLPAEHWAVGGFRGNLGRCLAALNRFEEAERNLLTGYDQVRNALGDDHKETQTIIRKIIAMYEKWPKPEMAAAFRAKLPPDTSQPTGVSTGI